MKKVIQFELFEKNQTIYFDILRLAELERNLGMTITDIVRKQDAGIGFCLVALQIGLKHHYHRATQEFYADKIEQFLDDGGTLDEVLVPIIRAIIASGIFGKEVSEKADEKLTEKNV